jgi:hypothetical protein
VISLITWLIWLASGMALLLSIGACIVTARLSLLYRSTSSEKLSARLTETEIMVEELAQQVRNLRAARNMAAHRAKKAEAPPETTEATDQRERILRETRAKLRNGS